MFVPSAASAGMGLWALQPPGLCIFSPKNEHLLKICIFNTAFACSGLGPSSISQYYVLGEYYDSRNIYMGLLLICLLLEQDWRDFKQLPVMPALEPRIKKPFSMTGISGSTCAECSLEPSWMLTPPLYYIHSFGSSLVLWL